MEIIKTCDEINTKAAKVSSSEGLVLVPAFAGLFAPQWRTDARGILIGLTQFHTSNHICRSALEAICLQVNDVLQCFSKDMGHAVTNLKVDGGVVNSRLCMQIQADVAGIPVSIPEQLETTSIGAAIAAKKYVENVDIESIKSIVK